MFNYVLAPVFTASYRGTSTIESNPALTPLSEVVTCRFAAPAGQVLQEILNRM
jgi:hypothetical protein